MDQRRGYSRGRVHRPYRLHPRYKLVPSRAPRYRFAYAKPEGRMYRGPVENEFYGQQSKRDMMHHHTGPEYHGPYRDQAKDISEDEDTKHQEQAQGSESHLPTKTREEFPGDKTANKNEISSEFEHSRLKSKKPNIEAHQVRLVRPQPHILKHHETIERRQRPGFYGEDRSVQLMNMDDSGNHDRERDSFMAARISSYEERKPNHYVTPDHSSSKDISRKPRLPVDRTRIKLIPPITDHNRHEDPAQRPREIVHGHYTHNTLDFKTPPYLLEMKRKILAKYGEQQLKHFRHPAYYQYSGPKDARDSQAHMRHAQRYNPDLSRN